MAESLGKRALVFPFPLLIMKQLAYLIGKTSNVDRLTQSLVIDGNKIRQNLNWIPPFTMADGLKITAKWFKSQR